MEPEIQIDPEHSSTVLPSLVACTKCHHSDKPECKDQSTQAHIKEPAPQNKNSKRNAKSKAKKTRTLGIQTMKERPKRRKEESVQTDRPDLESTAVQTDIDADVSMESPREFAAESPRDFVRRTSVEPEEMPTIEQRKSDSLERLI